jgi:hypothetical protein
VSTDQLIQTRLAWDLDRNVSGVRRLWGPRVLVVTRAPRPVSRQPRRGLLARALARDGRFWLVTLGWRAHPGRALGPGCLAALRAATRARP